MNKLAAAIDAYILSQKGEKQSQMFLDAGDKLNTGLTYDEVKAFVDNVKEPARRTGFIQGVVATTFITRSDDALASRIADYLGEISEGKQPMDNLPATVHEFANLLDDATLEYFREKLGKEYLPFMAGITMAIYAAKNSPE